ncbi:hypothetical protein GGF43_000035 [Coemansia sp. RSA 2618]|nr:hypothetical protein GGF43_000035 [Coemansia sp. RSA 2618]
MTGNKLSLAIPEATSVRFAILDSASSPHSPASSESSEATDADTSTVVSVQNSEYIWTPPALDPKYWEYVAKAQKIRTGVTELKQTLALKHDNDGVELQRQRKELRAQERKLMRYIDHHVLDYDDVIRAVTRGSVDGRNSRRASVADSKCESKPAPAHHVELGTISPPTSPDLAPNRPLPPLPPGAEQPKKSKPLPRVISGALPLTPPEKAAAAAAAAIVSNEDSRLHSNTGPDSREPAHPHKKTVRIVDNNERDARAEQGDAKEKPKSRLLRGLFGNKSAKPVPTANRRRSGSAEEMQLMRGSPRLASMSSVPTLRVRGRSDAAHSIYVL